jgi:hypothetical protein
VLEFKALAAQQASIKAAGSRVIEKLLSGLPSTYAQITGAGRQTFLKKLEGLSNWTGILLVKGRTSGS